MNKTIEKVKIQLKKQRYKIKSLINFNTFIIPTIKMYSRERDIKKEVAFMKVIQISDFHLRGDGKLSFQKADTMKALHQTIDYFCSMKDYELPEFL